MDKPLLKFNVTKRVPGFTLECQAAFEPGVTAVFGPSGSGKTMLLDCIAGLTTPDEGEIEAFGQTLFSSASGLNVPPERRRFGYVFQDSALFPHVSVRDNIMYGHKLTPARLRKIDPARLVELFQLSYLMDRRVSHLSGGERQRVALARSLAKQPQLLLLDEPLAALDKNLRERTQLELVNIQESVGGTFLMVTHDQDIANYGDMVVTLLDGQITNIKSS